MQLWLLVLTLALALTSALTSILGPMLTVMTESRCLDEDGVQRLLERHAVLQEPTVDCLATPALVWQVAPGRQHIGIWYLGFSICHVVQDFGIFQVWHVAVVH